MVRIGLQFDGVDFSDFNCWIDGSRLFDRPERNVETIEVIGRNGDLHVDLKRHANMQIDVPCYIRKDFKSNFANLSDFLNSRKGYLKFKTTEEPDVFRMASFHSEIGTETGQFNEEGWFTLSFDMLPQIWLENGLNRYVVTDALTLWNPTYQDAKPMIECVGTGTININGSTLTLNNNTSTTIIDFESENAYEGTINRNPDLIVENNVFPLLVKGKNEISVEGMTATIIPRWYRI